MHPLTSISVHTPMNPNASVYSRMHPYTSMCILAIHASNHPYIHRSFHPKFINQNISKLVGSLEHFGTFFHILGINIPADELIFFSGVAQPPNRKPYHRFNFTLEPHPREKRYHPFEETDAACDPFGDQISHIWDLTCVF